MQNATKKKWLIGAAAAVLAAALVVAGFWFLKPSAKRVHAHVPTLSLEYAVGGVEHSTRASMGGSWSWRLRRQIIISISCGGSVFGYDPAYPTVPSNVDGGTLRLAFSKPPTDVEIRRWPDKYIGDEQARERELELYDTVKLTDGAIALPRGEGHIYRVNARWKRGHAEYYFYVK